jgi:hypothetical protein
VARVPSQSPALDLAARRPVWIALSELFLDTTLDSGDLDRIARALARAPYSLDELDQILLWEVSPACGLNLYSIAGEWAAFNPAWLESRILRRPSLMSRAWTATVRRLGVSTSVTWRRIKQRVEAERSWSQ